MLSRYRYKPIQFFLITFLLTWIFLFIAAYMSYGKGTEGMLFVYMIAGLLVPCVTAVTMLYGSKNKALWNDFLHRLSIFTIKIRFIPIILFLMPCTVILATILSLFFGYSTHQFFLSSEYDVWKGYGAMFNLSILFLAPMIEELGWRGYGVDSIRAYYNLFNTSMLFAILWALWHLPLFFIKGYYHYTLWHTSLIYTINFFLSVIPAAILLNWVYYKNNRSIFAAILFHFMINIFSICFQTEQFTKCIITVLLLLVSAFVIKRDNKLFFSGNAVKL